MSKNIFNVLATNDDSDDERRQAPAKTQNKPEEKKDNKKDARAKDNQLREKFGDQVDKESNQKRVDGPRAKDNYGPNEKRPYERHSGTGKPAFKKNDYKKSGHGRGNAGALDSEKPNQENAEGENKQENKEEETKVNIVKLPEEEIVTIDDYINNTGATFGLKADNQQIKMRDPKAFEDANTKAIISKRTQQQDDGKKNTKTQEKKQTTKNVVAIDVETERKRDGKQGAKKGYVKFDKNEFPTLD